MSNARPSITLSDGYVWEYVADGKNARGEVKPYWLCPVLTRDDFSPLWDGHFNAPIHGPDRRGISILTAADHRAIADVLDPPTKEDV